MEEIFDKLDNTPVTTLTTTQRNKNSANTSRQRRIHYMREHFVQENISTSGEDIDSYVTRLRQIAKHCEFTDIERELHIQVLDSCYSKQLRKRAMEKTITFSELLEMARSMQLSNSRAETIADRATGHSRGNINRLQRGQRQGNNTQPRHQNKDRNNYHHSKNSHTTITHNAYTVEETIPIEALAQQKARNVDIVAHSIILPESAETKVKDRKLALVDHAQGIIRGVTNK